MSHKSPLAAAIAALALFIIGGPVGVASAQLGQVLQPMSADRIASGQFVSGWGGNYAVPAKVPVLLAPDRLKARLDSLASGDCVRLSGKTDEFKCSDNYAGCEAMLLEGIVFDCRADRWDRRPMFYKVVDVAASADSKVEITSTMTLEVKKADRGGGVSSGQMGYTFTAAPPVLAPRPVSECDPAAAARSNNTCEQPCIGMNALLMPMTGATGGETRIGQTVACGGVARSQLDLDAHEKVRAWDRCERGQAWGKEITLEVPVTGGILFQFPDSVFISAGSQKDKFLMHRHVREIALPVKVSCVG